MSIIPEKKKNKYKGIIIIIILIIAIALVISYKKPVPPTPNIKSKSDADKIRTKVFEAEKYLHKIESYGYIESNQKITLTPSVTGTIEKFLVNEGQEVKKGTKLVKLFIEGSEDLFKSSKVDLEIARSNHKVAKNLLKKGLISKNEYQTELKTYRATEARYKNNKKAFDDRYIKAPFNGFISDFQVKLGENVVAYQTKIAEFLDNKKFIVTTYLPLQKLQNIELGQTANIITNDLTYKAKVFYISPALDPETKTGKIKLLITDTQEMKLFHRQDCEVEIITGEILAHKISSSYLSPNKNKQIVVKIIDKDNIVQEIPVKILKETQEYLWVDNLPDQANIIILGFYLVKDGDVIDPLTEKDSDSSNDIKDKATNNSSNDNSQSDS